MERVTAEEYKRRETMAAEGSRGTEGVDGPRGKGMQDIAAPRDTRGRNLHDEAGDVLQFSQSSNHEVTRFPYMNGPFSLVCL